VLGGSERHCHEQTGCRVEPWTVDELAKLSNTPRATFARVFQRARGQPPMRYLSDWRMTLARDLLLVRDTTLAEIAGRAGAVPGHD